MMNDSDHELALWSGSKRMVSTVVIHFNGQLALEHVLTYIQNELMKTLLLQLSEDPASLQYYANLIQTKKQGLHDQLFEDVQ